MADKISIYRRPIPKFTETDKARFWAKVRMGSEDECWPWTAFISPKSGYGNFGYSKSHSFGAHRVAFFLANGRQPHPDCLHRCDYRPCCNPRHLWEGTQQENTADRHAKRRDASGATHGRHVHPENFAALKGATHYAAKLTEEDVHKIRHLFMARVPKKELAVEFNVSIATISHVIRGDRWRHLNLPSLKRKPIDP